VKVFPAVAAIVAVAGARREGRRRAYPGGMSFVAVMAAGGLLWVLLGSPSGIEKSLRFQTDRGFEVESTYAGLLFAASALGLLEARPTLDGTAWHLRATLPGWAAHLTFILQAGVLALVVLRMLKTQDRDLMRWTAAGVTAVVVTSKVLSPQFLFWLLPLAALLDGKLGRRVRRLLLFCCAATSLVYPWFFSELLAGNGLMIAILNVRNAALIWLGAYLIFRPRADAGDIWTRQPVGSSGAGETPQPAAGPAAT